MDLPDGEPDCGPWRAVAVTELYAALGRPRVLAVDGRSGSGKSTLVARLAATVPGTAVVHTDDVAWHHDFFDWADLLLDGVLVPWRAGRDVAYRPPPWDARGRGGAITVLAAAPLLVVEGVGAGRRAFAPHLDALIWVQTDRARRDPARPRARRRRRRVLGRVGGPRTPVPRRRPAVGACRSCRERAGCAA